jgi:hypothetical protein
VRRTEAFEICRNDPHRGERDRQLSARRRFERAARHREQLERFRDIGNGLGADRVVGDEQRRQLGDLGQGLADGRCIGVRKARCDACGTQRPGGVLCNARQGLGKFERL